jgi:hypothetical protein
MAGDVKAPPVAKYRGIEARESGSAIHAAIIRCHELERLRRQDQLSLLWVLTVRVGWWLAFGAAGFAAGGVLRWFW